MAEAKRPRDNAAWVKKVQVSQDIRSLSTLTFEELTAEDKEKLLKLIALRLGLITPSKD
jgi:hypothetical protein